MKLDVASYRRVAERWSTKEEDINPSAAAVLMLQMCSEIERLQKADYEFQEKLADGIIDAFLEDRWIAVSERLPQRGQFVLSYSSGYSHVIAECDRGEWRSAHRDSETGEPWLRDAGTVTHWMPLPEPPEVN